MTVETTLNIVREEPRPCQIKLNVEVPIEKVDAVFEQVEKRFLKEAKIPGFRPGKAPKTLLRKQYGDKIEQEVLHKLLEENIRSAIEQEGITPELGPWVENEESLQAEPGKEFVFTIIYDTPPEFELPDYRSLAIADEPSEVDEGQVDSAIENLLQNQATYGKVDRPAAADDMLKVSYKAEIDDEEFENYSETSRFILRNENGWLALREPEFLPGVTEALLGVSAGETREITVEFPDDYFAEDLSGKTYKYTIEVMEVQARETPELTDEVAQKMGFEGAEKIRNLVRDNLQNRQENEKVDRQYREIVTALTEKTDFELPPEKLNRETYDILSSMYEKRIREEDEKEVEKELEQMKQEAEKEAKIKLKQKFLLRRIAEAEEVKVEDNEIKESVEQLARHHKLDYKEAMKRLYESGRIMDFIEEIRSRKALERLRRILTEGDAGGEKADSGSDPQEEVSEETPEEQASV